MRQRPEVRTGSKSDLGDYLKRQRSRLGASKAGTATAHQLARILYHRMRYEVEYLKQTEAEYQAQQRKKQEKALHRRAKKFGDKFEKINKPEGESK